MAEYERVKDSGFIVEGTANEPYPLTFHTEGASEYSDVMKRRLGTYISARLGQCTFMNRRNNEMDRRNRLTWSCKRGIPRLESA